MQTEAKFTPETSAMPADTILKITKADLGADNFYVGATDVSDFDGSIEIAADLGRVRFKAWVKAKFSIRALAGSGISAGLGISAGDGISAGSGISAGDGISAGSGISAGFSVVAKWIEARLRIFAGLCAWREPTPEETEVRAELRNCTVAFGKHVAPTEVAE